MEWLWVAVRLVIKVYTKDGIFLLPERQSHSNYFKNTRFFLHLRWLQVKKMVVLDHQSFEDLKDESKKLSVVASSIYALTPSLAHTPFRNRASKIASDCLLIMLILDWVSSRVNRLISGGIILNQCNVNVCIFLLFSFLTFSVNSSSPSSDTTLHHQQEMNGCLLNTIHLGWNNDNHYTTRRLYMSLRSYLRQHHCRCLWL